jgi:hypothetical protein
MPLWLTPVLSAQPPIVGRPMDFSGAIGGPFVVTMSIDPSQVAIEEPFTLTLRIVGPGNLNEIARPALGKSDAFSLFAVDDLDDTFTDRAPPSRTFRYRLRARSEKATQIPAFKFVYFNPAIVPASRGYQTTYAQGFEVHVERLPVTIGRVPEFINREWEAEKTRPATSSGSIDWVLYQIADLFGIYVPAIGTQSKSAWAAAICFPPALCVIWYIIWRRSYSRLARERVDAR